MDDKEIELIVTQIRKKIGVQMKGASNPFEARQGLSFWFENYNRSNGPIFSIRPSGLKRHAVSLKFGAYAASCIKHIEERASNDDYALAYAFIEQLNDAFDVSVNGSSCYQNWNITPKLQINVTRKVSELHSSVEISKTIIKVMIPLIAAVAELIGYEDEEVAEEEAVARTEGGESEVLAKKRERNPRNRLLCLSIHGEVCGVCGFMPQDSYGSEFSSIIEVHHIEPLSELGQPRAYSPRTDLIPLCPNCHRAIHKRNPALTPAELKELMK